MIAIVAIVLDNYATLPYIAVTSVYKLAYYKSVYIFGTRSYDSTGSVTILNTLSLYGGLSSNTVLSVDVLIYP